MRGRHRRSTPGAVTVRPSTLPPFDLDVPGDPSQAAFWVVAACVVPGSDLVVEHVYVGPARAGFVDVLQRMGADLDRRAVRPGDQDRRPARPPPARCRPPTSAGAEVPGLIDEIPVLAVAAALAEGTTTFADAGELRVKESDRVATVTAGLGARRAPGRAPRRRLGRPRQRRPAAGRRGGRRPRRPPHRHGHGRRRPGCGRAHVRSRMGGRWRPATRRSRRICAVACHSHRRPGRQRQVDRRPGRGDQARAGLPRHRRHVPGGRPSPPCGGASTPTTSTSVARLAEQVDLEVADTGRRSTGSTPPSRSAARR